ncbi:MAG TPA: hypothetical protein ENO01_00295 [Candidatus Marinimicrobia bacterium]|nr:hypothetical protein [Candidatus Neomarinimicrobiota bacterium]
MKKLIFLFLVIFCVLRLPAETVQRNNTSLREGAGAFFPVVSILNSGDQVTVNTTDDQWLNVTTGDQKTGWVSANAFESGASSIDYGVMASDWTNRQASKTMVNAAVKGFFENQMNRSGMNRDILDRPIRLYFRPQEYVSFRDQTYQKRWRPNRYRRQYRLKQNKGFTVDETLFAISAYTAGRLTAPGLVVNPRLNSYVNMVAQLVSENTEFYDLPITVHIANSDDIYANALPIGVIVISRGMLKQISSEHELACLIGHEIAHVTLGHGETEMSKRRVKFRAEDAFGELDDAFGTDTKEMDELADEMFERAIKGRKEEYEAEADAQGAIYAYRAGYDPSGMITLMNKLESKIPQNQDPDDIRHWFPYSFKKRINQLQTFVNKDLKADSNYIKNENRYQMMTAGL